MATDNELSAQIARLKKAMQAKVQQAQSAEEKFVITACAKVEATAKQIMRDSPTDASISYGKHGHHPSIEGNPPAPDTGMLMKSVTHSVNKHGNEIEGYVGSILEGYPKYLEYGTSTIRPRPWLIASIIKCQSFIDSLWQRVKRGDLK